MKWMCLILWLFYVKYGNKIIIDDYYIVVKILTLRGVKVDWWKKYQDKPGDTLLYVCIITVPSLRFRNIIRKYKYYHLAL